MEGDGEKEEREEWRKKEKKIFFKMVTSLPSKKMYKYLTGMPPVSAK